MAAGTPVDHPGKMAEQKFRQRNDDSLKAAVIGVARLLLQKLLPQRQQFLRLLLGQRAAGKADQVDVAPAGLKIVHRHRAVEVERLHAAFQKVADALAHPRNRPLHCCPYLSCAFCHSSLVIE